jgi:hypothetical protein
MVRPFVSLPLEERLNAGRDYVPPGSGLVDHREGIGKPAVGTKELPAVLKPRDFLMIVGGAKDGYYMNLESAQRDYWRSTRVEQRGQAPGRVSDYIKMQCLGRAQR